LANNGKPFESVRAVARALDVLNAFSEAQSEMSAAELAQKVGLSRPTLYRLLYTLESKDFIHAFGEPRRFRLGPAAGRLTRTWTSAGDLLTVSEPILRALWNATGESVGLFVYRDAERLCLAELPSPQPLSFRRGVGHTELLIRGASGRAILAYMPTKVVEQLIKHADAAVNRRALTAELHDIRKRGYAVSEGELIPGAATVAAPFFKSDDSVQGAVGVFGPKVRLDPATLKRYGKLLVKQCRLLSRSLGHHQPE